MDIAIIADDNKKELIIQIFHPGQKINNGRTRMVNLRLFPARHSPGAAQVTGSTGVTGTGFMHTRC